MWKKIITACITFRASHLCILSVKKKKRKKKTLLGEEVKKESETKLFSHVRMKIALESDFSWRLIGSSVLLCVSASICVCVCVCGCWPPLYCACVRLERLQLQSGRWSAGARQGPPGNQSQHPINTSVYARWPAELRSVNCAVGH